MSKFHPSKITPELFDKLKCELKSHSNEWIQEVYNVGRTSLRLIDMCDSYAAYRKYYVERLKARKTKAGKIQQTAMLENKTNSSPKQCSFEELRDAIDELWRALDHQSTLECGHIVALAGAQRKIRDDVEDLGYALASTNKKVGSVARRLQLKSDMIRRQEDSLDKVRVCIVTVMLTTAIILCYLFYTRI